MLRNLHRRGVYDGATILHECLLDKHLRAWVRRGAARRQPRSRLPRIGCCVRQRHTATRVRTNSAKGSTFRRDVSRSHRELLRRHKGVAGRNYRPWLLVRAPSAVGKGAPAPLTAAAGLARLRGPARASVSRIRRSGFPRLVLRGIASYGFPNGARRRGEPKHAAGGRRNANPAR